jgi:hypothetical protein
MPPKLHELSRGAVQVDGGSVPAETALLVLRLLHVLLLHRALLLLLLVLASALVVPQSELCLVFL